MDYRDRGQGQSRKPRNRKDYENFKVTVRNEDEEDDYIGSEGKINEYKSKEASIYDVRIFGIFCDPLPPHCPEFIY